MVIYLAIEGGGRGIIYPIFFFVWQKDVSSTGLTKMVNDYT